MNQGKILITWQFPRVTFPPPRAIKSSKIIILLLFLRTFMRLLALGQECWTFPMDLGLLVLSSHTEVNIGILARSGSFTLPGQFVSRLIVSLTLASQAWEDDKPVDWVSWTFLDRCWTISTSVDKWWKGWEWVTGGYCHQVTHLTPRARTKSINLKFISFAWLLVGTLQGLLFSLPDSYLALSLSN